MPAYINNLATKQLLPSKKATSCNPEMLKSEVPTLLVLPLRIRSALLIRAETKTLQSSSALKAPSAINASQNSRKDVT